MPVATHDERAPAATESAPPARLFEPSGATLEDAILAALDDLTVEGRTSCPVCGGEMRPASGCRDCDSELV